jgi:putative SOS response-associated peptidase YedK
MTNSAEFIENSELLVCSTTSANVHILSETPAAMAGVTRRFLCWRARQAVLCRVKPKPIHARSESVESTKAFASAFLDGQRGIVLVKTFNEAPDVPGKTEQHIITPEARMSGIPFIWRKFDVSVAVPLFACVMVTVPANQLIATLPTDRMPAILDQSDWAKWLGEEPATVDELKGMLKTVEGVKWKMEREHRERATVREPTGRTLF